MNCFICGKIKRLIFLLKTMHKSEADNNADEKLMDEIKDAMLFSIGAILHGKIHNIGQIRAIISSADSPKRLWTLRSELYSTICLGLGETVAENEIEKITLMFKGFRSSESWGRHLSKKIVKARQKSFFL